MVVVDDDEDDGEVPRGDGVADVECVVAAAVVADDVGDGDGVLGGAHRSIVLYSFAVAV